MQPLAVGSKIIETPMQRYERLKPSALTLKIKEFLRTFVFCTTLIGGVGAFSSGLLPSLPLELFPLVAKVIVASLVLFIISGALLWWSSRWDMCDYRDVNRVRMDVDRLTKQTLAELNTKVVNPKTIEERIPSPILRLDSLHNAGVISDTSKRIKQFQSDYLRLSHESSNAFFAGLDKKQEQIDREIQNLEKKWVKFQPEIKKDVPDYFRFK